jgi:N-acetylglutamate synthase-like GNAT family acetyltransferase
MIFRSPPGTLLLMYTIRPAIKKDQAAIRALIRQAGINPMGIGWRRFLIAVNEGDELIGCGQVKPHRDGSLELASIAVEETWREQGIGRAIMTHLLDKYDPPLWLTCLSEMVPFYEKFGFVEIKEPEKMTPYFRFAKRFFRLYQLLTRRNIRLAVMVWKRDQRLGGE